MQLFKGCRAVKFYLVMPHPSPLLKEKVFPSKPLRLPFLIKIFTK
jgi:hypothetical protein